MSRAETNRLIEQIEEELKTGQFDIEVPEFQTGYKKLDESQGDILENRLDALRQNYYVDAEARRAASPLKKKIKKGIEKVAGIYVKPIVNDQNLYNINLLQTLEELCMIVKTQEKEIDELKQTIADLKHAKET